MKLYIIENLNDSFGLSTIKLGNIRIVLQLNNFFFSRCRAVLSTGYAKSDGFDGFALSSCDTAGIWLCSDGLDCVCKCFLVLFSLECEPWRPRWKNQYLASFSRSPVQTISNTMDDKTDTSLSVCKFTCNSHWKEKSQMRSKVNMKVWNTFHFCNVMRFPLKLDIWWIQVNWDSDKSPD